MTGSWSVLRPHKRLPARVASQLRIALRLDDDRTIVGVALPVLTVLRTRDEQTVVGHLGPDLLGADTTGADSIAVAAERVAAAGGQAVVAALLDQRRVAGLGNMWAQELLFLHGISPWRSADSVDGLEELLNDGRRRLRHAVRADPKQNTTGRSTPPHWVYGRARRPCLRCATPISFRAAELTAHGRETWWCPVCQPHSNRGESS